MCPSLCHSKEARQGLSNREFPALGQPPAQGGAWSRQGVGLRLLHEITSECNSNVIAHREGNTSLCARVASLPKSGVSL